ncbi:hypothetical protein [Tenacibaculum mesophilum]|uniref:Uncharacterized protein n=1 Tax=Tenacibaculum mesophilum TaxID=104268 RepID=A0AAE9SI48_9FLAO|nr:hypothetical protein [Tenacibaculum mesophilum]AZJ32545.1 hypothetical protein D6200_08275 [Tenacibaculum mesophilum]QFS27796.1 hypothetical protein F9Y86_05115 [Tenacibaculum mesophilum]UTD15226.1 hypothetical protein HER15_07025 [Tenacibaculum mesophilum]SHG08517.1 hypothetical protein SAMN05444344_2656 [Tenacibaculum mesophilum]
MNLIFLSLVVIVVIFILFFIKKKKSIKIVLSLLLLSTAFWVYLLSEREVKNKNSTFEIKHVTINDYYADYVFNFKGNSDQIESMFNYVYDDIKNRKLKQKKKVQEKIISGSAMADKSAKNVVNKASVTKEEIESSFFDYELLRPVENANPNDRENLIFKFIIDKEKGDIESIISKFTNTEIKKEEYKIESVNDTLSNIYLEDTLLNYNSFSKSLELAKKNKSHFTSNIYNYDVLCKNKFIFRIKYFERGKHLKVLFKNKN